ncbi:hypothetical protein [uncultured Clostridium sp.]|uniref:hypothetical protein n=1 Tax=uncultured Clostridium sp. TaxID=59620 RepID=UPI0028F1500E|nr:hypothetical protein [uncultured Clostridium sp.]
MFKKISIFIISVLFTFTFTACGSSQSNADVNTTKQEVQKEKTPEELEAEKEAARIAKEKEESDWRMFVIKNSKTLNAGEFVVGQHLDPFVYDLTFGGSGNLNIYDNEGRLVTNEIGGTSNDFGITRYRVPLGDGFTIKIKGMAVNPKPVKNVLRPYAATTLCSGYWFVGTTVTQGRYTVSVAKGSGNFIVYGEDGKAKVNEILGTSGTIGVEKVTVNLKNGDIINISGLNNIKFTPTK